MKGEIKKGRGRRKPDTRKKCKTHEEEGMKTDWEE